MSEIELVIFYTHLFPLVIPYLLVKTGTSLLSLRLEISVVFSLLIFQQPHSSVLQMVPLQCVFYHSLFLFSFTHFFLLDCYRIFLIAFAAYIPFHKTYSHQRNLLKVINLNKPLLYLQTICSSPLPGGENRINTHVCHFRNPVFISDPLSRILVMNSSSKMCPYFS